ncbi:MAG TPA: hypothetical protein DEO59_17045 [Balneola sp.]|nr:hypothetical protein [Balneola sp.]
MGQEDEQQFVVGDLVTGRYEFHSYYSYFYDDLVPITFIGIITHIAWDGDEEFTLIFYGPYYEVLCTDGKVRFFIIEELRKMS